MKICSQFLGANLEPGSALSTFLGISSLTLRGSASTNPFDSWENEACRGSITGSRSHSRYTEEPDLNPGTPALESTLLTSQGFNDLLLTSLCVWLHEELFPG